MSTAAPPSMSTAPTGTATPPAHGAATPAPAAASSAANDTASTPGGAATNAGAAEPPGGVAAMAQDFSALTIGVKGYEDDDDQVPLAIKHVALLAVRAFYAPECVVAFDTLLRYNQVTEGDLETYLKIDKANLRKTLNTLIQDRFVIQEKIKQAKEADRRFGLPDVISYSVSYTTLVNVVKYKLHEINTRIRQQAAKDADIGDINQLKYKCVRCGRRSTEAHILKAMEVLEKGLGPRDPVVVMPDGNFRCYFCGGDVDQDKEAIKINHAIGARESRFNSQIRILVAKIKEVDETTFVNKAFAGIQLPQAPEDANLAAYSTSSAYRAPGAAPALAPQWRAGRSSSGVGNVPLNDISVEIVESKPALLKAKERPVWMQTSTIHADEEEVTPVAKKSRVEEQAEVEESQQQLDDAKYLKYLKQLEEENRKERVNAILEAMERDGSELQESSSTSASTPDKALSMSPQHVASRGAAESYAADEPMVTINGVLHPLSEVTDDMAQQMTDEEYDAYFRLTSSD